MFLFVTVLRQPSRCNHWVYIMHIQIETITCMTLKLTSVVGHKKPPKGRESPSRKLESASQVSRCKAFTHELGQVDKAPVAPRRVQDGRNMAQRCTSHSSIHIRWKYPKTIQNWFFSEVIPDVGCLEERVEYIQVVNKFMLLLLVLNSLPNNKNCVQRNHATQQHHRDWSCIF